MSAALVGDSPPRMDGGRPGRRFFPAAVGALTDAAEVLAGHAGTTITAARQAQAVPR